MSRPSSAAAAGAATTSSPAVATDSLWALAQRVIAGARPLSIPAMHDHTRIAFINASPITAPLYSTAGASDPELPRKVAMAQATAFAESLIRDATAASHVHDRAAGALVGLALGDSVGAPLEFIPATSKPVGPSRPHLKDTLDFRPAAAPAAAAAKKGVVASVWDAAAGIFRPAATTTAAAAPANMPTSPCEPHVPWLDYYDAYNKFELKQGQWTDDSSMSLCLADSLLSQPGAVYAGGDCRVRYLMWWESGYNNAFRFDEERRKRCASDASSVGLGGNIAQSLYQLETRYAGCPSTDVPAIYESNGEEAGNGSIMRLAPVPIRWSHDPEGAASMAVQSSLATHPGSDAAACCAFLAFAVARNITRSPPPTPSAGFCSSPVEKEEFLNAVIDDFLASNIALGHATIQPSMAKLTALLRSAPPSAKEACWNWRANVIAIDETMAARGSSYNGHPNSAGYFGSYCMDGLAMALWSFHGATCFSECILRCVNLLGDSDSTGAVAGQLAGSYFGYRAISEPTPGEVMRADARARTVDDATTVDAASAPPPPSPPPTLGAVFLDKLYRHDRLREIPLRALMLAEHSVREATAAATAGNTSAAGVAPRHF